MHSAHILLTNPTFPNFPNFPNLRKLQVIKARHSHNKSENWHWIHFGPTFYIFTANSHCLLLLSNQMFLNFGQCASYKFWCLIIHSKLQHKVGRHCLSSWLALSPHAISPTPLEKKGFDVVSVRKERITCHSSEGQLSLTLLGLMLIIRQIEKWLK